ncbi:HPr family phosphocarrier protein [Ancylobacter dichloromethanicus]|uniref:Phosphocarrier protein HPr n=1 Tax=Ancylobacter dichloromethanicus TaxID=518825 RepID=A0A9W6J983_9HYPH|nr:HPr family phosphocarrier protein [Ancylobacter dichloromethanicus]MBS7552700.1 HPr family phosphocarrier protein [Ancylobacter dichloromethanicus]GLK72063.1 zinc transporter [Ancylobacter dichloromethanicus]
MAEFLPVIGRPSAHRCQTEVEVTHGVGLHARPSVAFTRLAKTFPCTIEVAVDGSADWLNGKSIVKIIGARIRRGTRMRIRAEGARAEEAIAALSELVRRDFDEDRKAGRADGRVDGRPA